MAETPPASPLRRRAARVVAVLAGVLVAWSLFGFLVAPSIVRKVLLAQAGAALKREVAVERVRVNPLALSVTIDGLRVRHRDGSPFLGWDSLYVRLSPLRMLRGDVGLAEIRLVRPALAVGLDARGALTFQDLVGGGEEERAPKPEEKPGEPIGVSIGRLAIEAATVTFTDATRKPEFASTLGPLTVRLESFRTKGGRDSPYTFAGTTDAGETFRWTGTVRTQPLRSSGTLAFERVALPRYTTYAQDSYPIEIHEGLLDFETAYELEWGAAHRFTLSNGRVAVDRLRVGPRGGGADVPVDLPRVEITGIDTDVVAQDAKVAEVAFRGGALRVRIERGGGMELMRMLPPPSPTPSPWKWAVGAVTVSGATMNVEDQTTPRPVAFPLTDVQVRLEQLKPGPKSVSPLTFVSGWNGKGRLAVKGSIQPLGDQGTVDLDATDLELPPLAPYLDASLAARLVAGRAGARAKVSWDMGRKPLRWTYVGDARIDGLSVAEAGNDELLRWRALELLGIDAASTPPRASARTVRLVEPHTKVYVWEDGATSIARVLRQPPPAAKEEGAKEDAPRAAPPSQKAGGAEWRTAIGTLEVIRGRATFVDRSVTPTAIVNLTRADARVARLSSDPSVRSALDVALEVEGASPIWITGTLNPLQKEAYSDVAIASKGVDLSPLGPYAGKHLGYGIQKGKLDLDLHYKVENRVLAGTNVVTLDQFTLGEKTDSPDATKLPVRLALALLQDPNGVILLDVPIEGKLDDPEFRLGKVIWRTVLNVLVKVVTSPFSALAALAGGEQADLSLVEFAPGTAEPLPSAAERYAALARSLAQRPALALELEGAAGADADGPALRSAALERALRRAKAAREKVSVDEVTLDAGERARAVTEGFEAAFPAPRKPGEPAPTPAEMEARLAAAQDIPADAYRALAAERAQHARAALLAAGLDQSRLFLVQGGERARKEQGARVYFSVR